MSRVGTIEPVAPRRRSLRSVLAWALVAFDLILALAVVVARPDTELASIDALLGIAFPITYGGVGAFLIARVPHNPIGPMLLAATTGIVLGQVGERYVSASVELAGGTWPGTALVGVFSLALWPPSLAFALIGIPLVFPSGRFISPRWRWVAAGMALLVGAATLGTLFASDYLRRASGLENPLAIPALEPWLAPLASDLANLAGIPILIATASAPLLRYRRGNAVERRQIRWLAAATLIVVVAFPASGLVPPEFAKPVESIGVAALAALPIAIGVAILRYRLYEIDRIISRTISYGVVTAVLVAVFAIVVVGFQSILTPFTTEQGLPVAASTLVCFALFQPLRRRVQSAIDRRFDRARYDGERTAAAFAAQLRDEVDLNSIVADLRAVVGSSLQPGSASIWIRSRNESRTLEA